MNDTTQTRSILFFPTTKNSRVWIWCSYETNEITNLHIQIHKVQNCFDTWDCPPNIHRLYSYFRIWRMSINGTKWIFLLCVFFVASFHSSSTTTFSPAPCETSICTCSRFASLTFLRNFQTLLHQNHDFPRQGWQNIILSLHSFLPDSTLESNSYSRTLGLLERFLCHSNAVGETKQRALAFSFKKWGEELYEIYISERIRALIKKWLFAFLVWNATLWSNWTGVSLLQHNHFSPRQTQSGGALMNPSYSECYLWSFSRLDLFDEQNCSTLQNSVPSLWIHVLQQYSWILSLH